ncbi:condensation domain-containing protein [Actinoplanes sp. NPDC051470]|uniref:condensation domain-containing protein n=1 Tax=Actinoplanes sp. NPDC051470 TaxID=3157224 RepID=UPI0034482729
MARQEPQELTQEARELLRRRLEGAVTAAPTVAEAAPRRPPLSLAQRRLWFIDRLTQGSLAYNVAASYRLSGPLDPDALDSAVRFVARRHDVLRTHFEADGDAEPYQVVSEAPPRGLERHDLSAGDDPSEGARALARAAADTQFDLDRGPLFRTWLAKLGPADHVLGLVVHHTLFDRESLEVWAGEVSAAYAAYVQHLEPGLAPLPAQYADYAVWQHRSMAGPRLDAEARHWRERLRGVPSILELPADHDRPATPTYRAGAVPVAVPGAVAADLRELTEAGQASLFMTGLAAFQGLLSRYTASADVIVGCPFNGRTQVRFEGLIGFFANSLPIHADLGDDPSFAELLRRTRETMLEAHEHQDVPFDRIVQEVAPPRDLGRNPLFQVWFDLSGGSTDAASGLLGLGQVEASFFNEGRVRTRFDLELHLNEESGGGLGGRLLYARDLLEDETARTFVDHYQAFLAAVAVNPHQRISEVPIFSADQLRTILVDWGTAAP